MTQMVRPRYFTAPVTTRLPGTLLDAAELLDGVEWLEPEGMYPSYNCLQTSSVWDLCPTGDQEPKTFSPVSWVDGIRFSVYGGITCKGVGFDSVSAQENLERVFMQTESTGVERAIMDTIFTGQGTFDPAVDLTPAGGALDAVVGLALLEGYAAQHYVGVPTIHAPRALGSLLMSGQAIGRVGAEFFSKQGSKVASGAGYYPNVGPTGAAPAAGSLWMYVTGEVTVSRGGIVTPPAQIDRVTNEVYLLAERMYVATTDCLVAAVQVSIS